MALALRGPRLQLRKIWFCVFEDFENCFSVGWDKVSKVLRLILTEKDIAHALINILPGQGGQCVESLRVNEVTTWIREQSRYKNKLPDRAASTIKRAKRFKLSRETRSACNGIVQPRFSAEEHG